MYVRNLNGDEYPLQATTTHDLELNGNQSLSFKVLPTKANKQFIDDITEMWEVVDDTTHKIIYAKRKGEGNSLTVDIKAIPLFFDDFDTQRIYEEYNQHMTANACFSLIFQDSGYNFVLSDSFDAIQWEGFGAGDTRLALFKKALNRYKAEFRISGNTIYLESQIGRDTQFMYRHKLNASNIIQEIDAGALWTYAKGYGNFAEGDEQNANLIREYTSPIAQIIGLRHAPPIKNGSITTNSQMDAQLKTLVDDSLKISVSADIHDLRKQGYALAQPQLGDRTFLIDERIGLKDEVRVVNLTVTKDWKGNILNLNLVFGSEGIVKRHQSNLSTAVSNITNLLEGRIKLPFSVLDNAVAEATKALQAAQSELIFSDNGILAVDKNDPNLVTIHNSAGFGVSDDGGATFKQAMTGNGISASVVTTGTLRSIVVDAVEIYGSIIEGTDIYGGTILSENSSSEYTKIQGGFFEARGRHTRTWRGSTSTHDIRLMAQNGYFRARNNNENWSLYYSDWGISTYADGTGDNDASGYIEFHSRNYSPTNSPSGLTIGSLGGRLGFETDEARIYLNPNGAGVHVGRPDDTYYSIHAASFTQSSARELKRDIKDLQDSGLDVVNSMRIREYFRLTNGEETMYDQWQAGLILDEAPVQLVDGLGLDIYTAWAYTAKAVQELSQRLEGLENETA